MMNETIQTTLVSAVACVGLVWVAVAICAARDIIKGRPLPVVGGVASHGRAEAPVQSLRRWQKVLVPSVFVPTAVVMAAILVPLWLVERALQAVAKLKGIERPQHPPAN